MYTAIGKTNQHEFDGDISYEPFRQSAHASEKQARHVSFHIPQNVSASIQRLTSNAQRSNYKKLPEHSRVFWNPRWLGGPSFLLFATWYMLLIIATATLYIISEHRSGLVGQTYVNRYSWTYGPTAVLVLTLSAWFHIEFWSKELAPWARMRKIATPANHGLLADYFTKAPYKSLWQAFRVGDHAVWLSILGTLLLHLAIIASTSVISLEPAAVSNPLRLTVRNSFLSSSPNISVQALNGNALFRYFGINSRNLTYPVGTSANLTVTSFLPQSGYAANSTFEATVPGVSASLECEPIPFTNLTSVTSQPWRSILAPVFTTNISVPSCNIIGVPIAIGLDHDPPFVNTLSAFQGWWNNYTCNDGVNNAEYSELATSIPYRPFIPGFDDQRLVFITSYIQWTARSDQNETRQTWVQNFTGIICKPRYSVDYYDVQMSPGNLHTKTPFSGQLKKGTSADIDGFANSDLAAMIKRDSVLSQIVNTASRQTVIAVVDDNRGYLRAQDPFFLAMSADSDMAALSNHTTMLTKIPMAFSGVAAQAFQEYLTVLDSHDIDGTVQVYEMRLKANAVPVGLILGFLSILILISILLIFLGPWNCVPSDPHTIAAKAKFLAASPALSYHLRPLNGLNMHEVQARLGWKRYKTVIGQHNQEFVIVPEAEPIVAGNAYGNRNYPQESSIVWWRPLNHRFWFVFMIVFSPLAIIAVLQVLQHISDTRDGILDVTGIGTRRVLVTLTPAAILSIVALSFQALHFNSSLTAPFNSLKHGGAPHSRGLTVSMLGKTSPHAFFVGLRHHLLLPCMTALCVMVGAFLTIVVSGLYYIENVPISEQVVLRRSDAFNFTRQDLSLADNLAGATTKLLLKDNLTDPPMTYNGLVFPAVQVPNLPFQVNGSTVDLQLPAIRPTLRCYPNSASEVYYDRKLQTSDGSLVEAQYQTNFTFPCPGNSSTCSTSWGFLQEINPNKTGIIIGRALDVTTESCLGQDVDEMNYSIQRGCPSLYFALGNTSTRALNDSFSLQTPPSLQAFICFAYMEEVQTNLTLILPEYAISTAAGKAPMTIESTARNLTFSSSYYQGPIYMNALSTLITALDGSSVQVDPLIDAIVKGTNSTSFADFLGTAGAARLPARASQLYADYMVNAISSNFRVSPAMANQQSLSQQQPADMQSNSMYEGVLYQTNRQCLMQDPGTKIALQVMLGFMTLVACVVFLLTDRKLRLPTNPCSIAGTMLLLAGSEMINRSVIPESSEWNNDTHIWQGWLFSLGWWSDGQGRRFGIDIGNANTGVTNAVGSVMPTDNDGVGRGGGYGRDDVPHPNSVYDHTRMPSLPETSRTRASSMTIRTEVDQYELRHLKPFVPLNVHVPSGRMGWDDNLQPLPQGPIQSMDSSSTSPWQRHQGYPGDPSVLPNTRNL